jgi:hypothetical protein
MLQKIPSYTVAGTSKWLGRKLLWALIAILGAFSLGIVALTLGETISAAWFVIAAVCVYLVAFRFYALFIANCVLGVDPSRPTPAYRHNDGLDYVTTNEYVLFGHHFAAIAGAGPLVGPVLAAQMGYLPGTLWIDGREDEQRLEQDRKVIPDSHLWNRIEAHNFEPDQPFNFVQRLGRDHGWTLKEARSAVEEYKRFCFLAVVSPTPVTPSEAVDEVWHQHLIYSKDYWDLWCGTVLQTTLHHDPTPGGPEAQRRYHRQYAETLALYERYFGQPDEAWWPGTRARFGPAPRYRIVDTQQRYMFPKLWPFLHRILERR